MCVTGASEDRNLESSARGIAIYLILSKRAHFLSTETFPGPVSSLNDRTVKTFLNLKDSNSAYHEW